MPHDRYTPRRASKRWLDGAPPYVLDVLDNKGQTSDRYTILFTFPLSYALGADGVPLVKNQRGAYSRTWIQHLSLSDAPGSAQGVSLWGELKAHEAASYRYRCKHQRIRWSELPEHIRAHVLARAEED